MFLIVGVSGDVLAMKMRGASDPRAERHSTDRATPPETNFFRGTYDEAGKRALRFESRKQQAIPQNGTSCAIWHHHTYYHMVALNITVAPALTRLQ